jgi:AraC family transcriptional regulator
MSMIAERSASIRREGPDRLIFCTESVTIGAFRCPPDHPSFRDSGPIKDDCFVFPRTAVVIQHCDDRPFVADPSVVTLYNRNQVYERRPLSSDGDRCDWYAVSPGILRSALLDHDPSAADDHRPIRLTHAPADPATYLEQRRLFVHVSAGIADDALAVEERVVALLDRVLRRAYRVASRPLAARRLPHAVDLAEAAKRWVAPRVAERLTLARIAGAVDCSAFHLCRSFRQATGVTLQMYREQVRLRMALERLEDGERDLTRLALDLGYSSHSHFTAGFRRAFGQPPSLTRRSFVRRLRASFR